MRTGRRFGYLAAALLVVATNGFVLAHVARNRSGPPESVLELSQREAWLEAGSRRDESTGAFLHLRVNGPWAVAPGEATWLDEAKLAELGFDVERIRERREKGYPWRVPPREVFVAMEFEGPAWREHLLRLERDLAEKTERFGAGSEQAERALDALARARRDGSRLFAIDADRDPKTLRRRHPDRTQVAIAPAKVSAYPAYSPGEETRIRGHIQTPLVSRIHLPKRLARHLPQFPRNPEPASVPPGRFGRRDLSSREVSYRVRLQYGSSHEPWIGEIEVEGKPGRNP